MSIFFIKIFIHQLMNQRYKPSVEKFLMQVNKSISLFAVHLDKKIVD